MLSEEFRPSRLSALLIPNMGAGINQLMYIGNAKSSSGGSAQELQVLASEKQKVNSLHLKSSYIYNSENSIQTLEFQHKRSLSLGDNNKMFIMSS